MKKNKMSIEDTFNKLDIIIEKIENDNISIDEMINLYEEGSKLYIECKKKITVAENKIDIIKKRYIK